ncbi:hypothetical protein [Fusobacterium hwasookii]|uniref:Uncharacterized protein n=1 Tax=Fusobacterium hwasookii ChDC F128 TaxID=1216362 RepID=A0ABN0H1L1_9FUSO|nr:hypothetical protein [Fusobacterium hwasookii]EJU08167.1 hypothetical protein B437_02581 [Fusobacterium hwasookii ChDC F128]QNE65953.1 hypothetical protein H5V36_08960 [Fusobacterium hwasookii]
METVSIRKKVNETIIIQNSKRAFKYSLTTIIGMYCTFNLLGISSIDITYKFSLIWLFLVLLFAVRPALKRRGIKVFLRVNNQKITIKKQKVFGKDEENSFLLKDIENIFIETERKGGKVLVIKMLNNIEDRSISTINYISDLRMIRKIILEYKRKGEEEWNF